ARGGHSPLSGKADEKCSRQLCVLMTPSRPKLRGQHYRNSPAQHSPAQRAVCHPVPVLAFWSSTGGDQRRSPGGKPWSASGGGSSSRFSAAARRRGRLLRQGHSRATACGASAYSWRETKTILSRSVASLPSRKRLRTWVGPMAATCGWTFG